MAGALRPYAQAHQARYFAELHEAVAHAAQRRARLVYSDADAVTMAAVKQALEVLQQAAAATVPVTLLTHNAMNTGAGDAPTVPWQSALWGLARSARIEMPHMRLQLVDVSPGLSTSLGTGCATVSLPTWLNGPPELAIRGNRVLSPRWVAQPTPADDGSMHAPGGRFLISGGSWCPRVASGRGPRCRRRP